MTLSLRLRTSICGSTEFGLFHRYRQSSETACTAIVDVGSLSVRYFTLGGEELS